ncbi:MAG: hypothetical protein U0572_14885 [Phycisphaerales bacterium]
MTNQAMTVAAACALVATAVPCNAQTFTFDSDTAGWAVYDIYYNGQALDDPQPILAVPFDGGLGLPPGSARVSDLTSETWIGATAAVAGDRSALYGATSISYDVYFRYADAATYAAIAIYGGGLTLYVAHESPALDQWLHWDFPLAVGEWRVGSIFGELASEDDVLQVLGDLHGVFIHTEWKTGPDDTNVDNIAIGRCVGGGGPGCCPADLDQSGEVNAADLAILLGQWGATGSADVDADGLVGAADLGILLGAWGSCG